LPASHVCGRAESAKATLTRLPAWLEQNNRVILIILSAVFAALFLYKGINGLIS
jgi:hypothetical protein